MFLVVNWCFLRLLLFFADISRFARFCTVFNTFVLFCAVFAVFSYLLHKTKVGVGFSGIYNISSSFRWCFWSILPQLECLELNITFVLLFWFLSISNHFLWFSNMYIRNQKSQKIIILLKTNVVIININNFSNFSYFNLSFVINYV